ncbi:MAG: hypothetical protein R6U68_04575 [Desulfobacteraceae bacterium]
MGRAEFPSASAHFCKRMVPVFLISLVCFEIFSFFLVFASNHALFNTMVILNTTPHIVVPNHLVLPSLNQILPAFYGSLFITVTGGTAVSSTICLGVCLMSAPRVFQNKKFLIFLSVTIVGGIFFISANHSGPSIFLKTRDFLLLAGRPGTLVNNFYYKYTLYASQAISAPLQKQIKTCWIDSKIDKKKQLSRVLEKNGWLAVNTKKAFLIVEKKSDNAVVLKHRHKVIVSASLTGFLKEPFVSIKEFSRKMDNTAVIRLICLAGLVLFLPLICCALVFSGFFYLYALAADTDFAFFLSLVTLAAMVFFLALYINPGCCTHTTASLLTSESKRERIHGLMGVYMKSGCCRAGIDPYLEKPLNELSVPEKYWLAQILSRHGSENSNTKKYRDYLKKLIEQETSVNVKCAAVKALAASGCTEDSRKIFHNIINTSPHWYVQHYALNAIRHCAGK